MLFTITNFIFCHTPVFYLTQSVWRDEAFSYFMAKPNILKIVINTANDFNPPLYYLLLHFWMKIAGKQDIWLRLLSFFPHLVTVYIAYNLAEKVFSKKFAIFMAAFTMFNPMLLYYAFEMRMYSFYALFVLSSLYFFYLRNWRLYTLAAVLGLYTHSFFSLVLVSYILYLFFTKQLKKKSLFLTLKPFLFFLPWLPVVVTQFFRSGNTWIFPVDFQLIKAVLGNLFTNYEGTPGSWWGKSFILSVFIIAFFSLAFKRKRKQAILFLTPIFAPLLLILGYSVIRRPIYVNRYMIFVAIFEIIGISMGVWCVRNKKVRYLFASLWFSFIIFFNLTTSPHLKKTDFKTTFAEINKISDSNDFVYTKTPISFLESAYYYRYPDRVFIYNPKNITIPNYIGISAVFPNASKPFLPPPPSRTFLVADDASFEVIIKR